MMRCGSECAVNSTLVSGGMEDSFDRRSAAMNCT